MLRAVVGLLFAIVLISCAPRKPADDAWEGKLHGPAPFTITNFTALYVQFIELETADAPPGSITEHGTIYLGENYHSKVPPIPPKGSQAMNLKPGSWYV